MQKHCVAFNVVKASHQPILPNVSNWQKRIIVSKVYIGNWYEPLKVMKTKFFLPETLHKDPVMSQKMILHSGDAMLMIW